MASNNDQFIRHKSQSIQISGSKIKYISIDDKEKPNKRQKQSIVGFLNKETTTTSEYNPITNTNQATKIKSQTNQPNSK
jgi:hypothetical protein